MNASADTVFMQNGTSWNVSNALVPAQHAFFRCIHTGAQTACPAIHVKCVKMFVAAKHLSEQIGTEDHD